MSHVCDGCYTCGRISLFLCETRGLEHFERYISAHVVKENQGDVEVNRSQETSAVNVRDF